MACTARTLRTRLERRASIDARWIPVENLHLTIRFLGEVPDSETATVLEAIQPPLPVAPFTLAFADLGIFPPSGPPRLFWIGIGQGASALSRLYFEVGARLSRHGFEAEPRPFAAHLTLARVRAVGPRAGGYASLRSLVAGTPVTAASSSVTHLTVFRSHLLPKGARYEPVMRVPLEG